MLYQIRSNAYLVYERLCENLLTIKNFFCFYIYFCASQKTKSILRNKVKAKAA